MTASMHPYKNLPRQAYWRGSVAAIPPSEVDPVVSAPFGILPSDKVATAGSCFAQHIARYLSRSGFNFLVTERAHPLALLSDAQRFGYGLFTARYGNIYTSRQLVQLFLRAFGQFQPEEDYWQEPSGIYIDPFRPQIQPGGFATFEEYTRDRQQHFSHVRDAFRELDVFVFTLGLTECWTSASDGAAYPLCPGVAGGEFDPAKYTFTNLDVDQIRSDLEQFIALLLGVNPRARLILTVSPVPLAATAEPRHVLCSTTYSKAVLRVVCESIVQSHDRVAYFPSYEIVTGSYTRGKYFGDDLRSVTEEGVSHVMRLFLKHYGGIDDAAKVSLEKQSVAELSAKPEEKQIEDMKKIVQAMCDEELLDITNKQQLSG